MADALCENQSRDLWCEVKKVKGKSCRQSNVIDGAVGREGACQVFHDTYKALYQSVPSDEEELNDMFNELREGVYRVCQNGECYSDHKIIVHDVIRAVKKLKTGKSDVDPDITSGLQPLYVAWKKSIKRVFRLHPRTRSRYVDRLLGQPDLRIDLMHRFAKFWTNCNNQRLSIKMDAPIS
ncbi:hypothetical protein CAPTEDRAFT_205332 [Capitella teleta]|uniref:Uncharacterized protein n=1 Tax=Capitella teleta TaxID=283909 RepID=R7T6P7_CAPTE|nr:hypothetical protein CAPTEDRAFT_205332 [Capitella teleta]|eukprot:ELT87045.1 hypothetical protein CAPTEDRAFT_205332 [Capitella teleta]